MISMLIQQQVSQLNWGFAAALALGACGLALAYLPILWRWRTR
jgi:ABC-type spermidine/putrescine transport system permease subunit I